MSRWFRLYTDAMRNPKVARLTDKDFRLWVELLGVAADGDGLIPCLDDLKHVLKRRLDHLSTGVERLISMGLIDALDTGYAPHNWIKRQYKSDVSTERVQKHRAKGNVSETPPETETETETEEDPPTPQGEETILLPEHVVEAWNTMAERNGLAKVKRLGPDRLRKLRARIRENTIDDFTEAIGAIERSRFLCEGNGKTWRGADFDFLLQPSSFTKLIEGSYDQPAAH